MGLTSVFIRFILVYSVLVVLTGTLLQLFSGASISGLNIGILAGTLFWCCSLYVKSNQRWFSAREQLQVIAGISLINLLVQGVFALVIAGTAEVPHLLAILGALLIVGLMHSLVVWAVVLLAKRSAKKQLSAQADLLASD